MYLLYAYLSRADPKCAPALGVNDVAAAYSPASRRSWLFKSRRFRCACLIFDVVLAFLSFFAIFHALLHLETFETAV